MSVDVDHQTTSSLHGVLSTESHAAEPSANEKPPLSAVGLLDGMPVWLLTLLLVLVPQATGNLTALGLGGRYPLLYDSIALPRFVLTAVLGSFAWLTWFIVAARRNDRVRVDGVWPVLAALAAWAAISAAASPHWALAVFGQSERLEGVLTIAGYALLYGIALQCTRGTGDARRIASGLGVGATIAAAYGVAQSFGWEPSNYSFENYGFNLRQAFGTFGNPNFLAGLLVLALPIVGVLAVTAHGRTAKAGWCAAAAIIGWALFATATRGAWLAVAMQLVVLAVWWSRHRSGFRTLVTWAFVLVLVLAVGVVTVSLMRVGESQSAGDRMVILGVAAAAAAEHPVLGYGPDSFLAAFRANRSDAAALRFGSTFPLNNAHSWPLQYAATLGLPGAMLLLLALAISFWRARSFALSSSHGPTSLLFLGILVGSLGFVTHMLFSVAVLGATTPFWVILGVLAAPSARSVRVPQGLLRAGAVSSGIGVCLVILAAVSLVAADRAYISARLAYHHEVSGDALALSERAVRLNPLSIKYSRGNAEVHASETRDLIEGLAPEAAARASLAGADARFRRTLRLDAADYPALAWRASLQAESSEYLKDVALGSDAVRMAKRAARLDRQHIEVEGLANGDTSAFSARAAALVPALP